MGCGLYRSALLCSSFRRQCFRAFRSAPLCSCAKCLIVSQELYAIERLVPGSFPGNPGAQTLRAELRRDRSRPVLDQIWTWATEQAGLPRSDFGKAVRYMLERWTGLTRFVENPRIPLDNN